VSREKLGAWPDIDHHGSLIVHHPRCLQGAEGCACHSAVDDRPQEHAPGKEGDRDQEDILSYEVHGTVLSNRREL
jgi:hypothetical protein